MGISAAERAPSCNCSLANCPSTLERPIFGGKSPTASKDPTFSPGASRKTSSLIGPLTPSDISGWSRRVASLTTSICWNMGRTLWWGRRGLRCREVRKPALLWRGLCTPRLICTCSMTRFRQWTVRSPKRSLPAPLKPYSEAKPSSSRLAWSLFCIAATSLW